MECQVRQGGSDTSNRDRVSGGVYRVAVGLRPRCLDRRVQARQALGRASRIGCIPDGTKRFCSFLSWWDLNCRSLDGVSDEQKCLRVQLVGIELAQSRKWPRCGAFPSTSSQPLIPYLSQSFLVGAGTRPLWLAWPTLVVPPPLGTPNRIKAPSLLVSRSARSLRWRLSAPSRRVRLPTSAGIGPTVTATAGIGTTDIGRQRARRCDRRETFSALEVTAIAWLTISTRFGGHQRDDGWTQGDRLAMGNTMVPASKAVAACSSDVDDHCELVVTSFKSSRRTAARPSI